MNRDLLWALVFLAMVAIIWLPNDVVLVALTVVNVCVAARYLRRYWRSRR